MTCRARGSATSPKTGASSVNRAREPVGGTAATRPRRIGGARTREQADRRKFFAMFRTSSGEQTLLVGCFPEASSESADHLSHADDAARA